MQALFILLFLLFTATEVLSQVQEFYVKPEQTDARYPAQDSHLVAFNTITQNGKLFLFIGGTFSSPKTYDYITRHAASLGFDAINVTYPNSVLTTLLAGSSDSLAFDKFRQEICFGTQVSSAVNVDTFNSIYTRAVKLIQFLSQLSSHNWGQYFSSDSTLDWSKIVVSGHSQGAGHACYLAKTFSVERVVMFSGPNDYSTYFGNAAPWLRVEGTTPLDKHFAFLHLQDEIVPFAHQFANITGLGMLQADDTTLVDDMAPPFSNSRCLYSNQSPGSSGNYHNSTVIYSATPLDGNGNPVFTPIWDYMLTGAIATGTERTARKLQQLKVYPNPVKTAAMVETVNSIVGKFSVTNISGTVVFSGNILSSKSQVNFSGLKPGVYFIHQNRTVTSIVKE